MPLLALTSNAVSVGVRVMIVVLKIQPLGGVRAALAVAVAEAEAEAEACGLTGPPRPTEPVKWPRCATTPHAEEQPVTRRTHKRPTEPATHPSIRHNNPAR